MMPIAHFSSCYLFLAGTHTCCFAMLCDFYCSSFQILSLHNIQYKLKNFISRMEKACGQNVLERIRILLFKLLKKCSKFSEWELPFIKISTLRTLSCLFTQLKKRLFPVGICVMNLVPRGHRIRARTLLLFRVLKKVQIIF